jgi:hypothetical protein
MRRRGEEEERKRRRRRSWQNVVRGTTFITGENMNVTAVTVPM